MSRPPRIQPGPARRCAQRPRWVAAPLRILHAVVLLAAMPAFAADDPLDNVIVTRSSDAAMIRIVTACRTGYETHLPATAGIELRITLRPGADCGGLAATVAGRTYQPVGRELAGIDEIAVDIAAADTWYVTLRFVAAVRYSVRPHPSGWLEVAIEQPEAAAAVAADRPPPLAAAGVPRDPAAAATRPSGRSSRLTQQVGASVLPDETFVVQLGVFADAALAQAALARADVAGFPYTTAFATAAAEWQALQVGFYASEAEAEQVLAELLPLFPDAWVRLVTDAERRAAEADGALVAGASGALAVAPRRDAVADDATLARRLEEASTAIIDRRYDDAVEACTTILEVPANPYRARAREYIGVALERSGRTDRAVAEYRAWLAEFGGDGGDGDGSADAARVTERLRALTDAPAPAPAPERLAAAAPTPQWALYGGVSQYYWRNEEQFVDDGNHVVSSTGILSLADVTATRSGTRFDLQARLNGAYQFDLIEYDGDDHTGWITNAYVDIADRDTGLRGRAGRQARRQDGVIGRFDGASVDYALTERISFGASAGLPVDSPRYRSGSHRSQFGLSSRLRDVVPGADLNVYVQRQTVDGIVDREALGAEVRYGLWDVALFGTLDYDVGYGEINLAMLNAQWLLPAGWTVNLRAETGVQPFITTRNALAGQGVASVEALLENYSEEEVRELARDRTGSASRLAAGFSIPLSERFDLSLDASVRRFGGTVASGGVVALPDSGAQTWLAATLVSTSLFSSDDLNTLSLRYDASYTRDKVSLLVDSRIAIGERLRVRPALVLSQLEYDSSAAGYAGDSREFVVEPSLRLYYRWKRVLFDAEAGLRYAERENPARPWDPFSPDGQEQLSGMYLNLGYQMEF